MGASQSKNKFSYNTLRSPSPGDDEKRSVYDEFTKKLQESSGETATEELQHVSFERWEQKLLKDPKNRLALSAISRNDIKQLIQQPDQMLKDEQVFSDQVSFDGAPITNQRSSGRCWIFAATSVFRVNFMKKYKLASFELSQSYLFFYDKLEKANYFLEQVIDTANEDLEGRLVNHLFQSPVGDGGQFDMIINIVEKYGLVPQSIYPDSYNAKFSSTLNWVVTNKLREDGLKLRELLSDKRNAVSDVRKVKQSMIQEIYNILVIALGVPPKASSTFEFNFRDKNEKFQSIKTTPLEFYQKHVAFPAKKYFSLVNDPRHEYGKLLTVDRLSNVVEGIPIRYINVDMETMKKAAIKMIKADQPVFYGSDVGKFLADGQGKGIMDINLFNYDLAFGIRMGMDKAQRLRVNESAMTHAMVLHGVHIVDNKPTKWKVQNSWGPDRGQDGWYLMTDPWMDEYCYQIVTSAEFVPKEIADILETEPQRLPVWDPLGALA